ncbi:response regulator transcription factor [Desulfopila sp. IMCC35008]|uniref:response regulator transcription factor n=1 Tax=Desulfopila sp. IMCC35008 TaxID=2653858 RepID=UPI0013CFA05C|nr:response regulator [Desulfopila sp. IMCC35008]
MSTSKAKVYIVEDDASFSDSMETLLSISGFEVETFACGFTFLTDAEISYPGCLLLDVKLPDIDGLHLQQCLRNKGSILPIVFMTGHGSIPMGVKAIKKGAIDFLAKPFKPEELLQAVDEAIERNCADMHQLREKDQINELIKTLTPREKEVLTWVITGQLNKQIAYELGTKEKTIRVHRSRMMQKLKASSVAELVRLAQKAGISPAV